jgi:membrane protein CcdC involved in cytochrome C biogenesis
MQTWWGSIVESWANIAIGFAINWTVNISVLPWLWDNAHKMLSAFYIGLVFTVVSQIRQLVIRRYFNRIKFGNAEPAQ